MSIKFALQYDTSTLFGGGHDREETGEGGSIKTVAIENVLSPENFVSTIYTKLGIDPDKILYTPQGHPSHLVSDPTPIRELC